MNCPPRIGEEICTLYESTFLKALETLNMSEKTSAVSLITGDAVKSIGKYIVQKNVGANFIVFLVKVFLLILLFPVIFCDSMLLVSNMLLIFFHRN